MYVLIACEESQRVCMAFRELDHTALASLPPAERSRERSKTFPGIAKAMAEQWGGNV